MSVLAYACFHPYLESPPQPDDWGQPIDQLYLDQNLPDQPRTMLQQLLQDCTQTPPCRVIAWRLGDLGDSPEAVFACIAALEAEGIEVITRDGHYHSPAAPSSGATSQQWIHLTTLIQTQHQSQRLQAGHAHNRLEVLPPPGRAPYGYRRGRYRYALDRATAPVVKSFFEHFILYGSIRGAVRYLEKNYGKKISASTAQRWLTHPIYRGDLAYKDGHRIRDTHTPIISREEAAQVDRLLRRNRRLPPKTASAGRSLAGLVQCQECQNRLKITRVSRRQHPQEYLYLRPIQCDRPTPCRAIAYGDVLDQTLQTITETLPHAVANLPAAPLSNLKGSLQRQIEQQEAALERLPNLVNEGILDNASAQLRAYTLRSQISELQQQISQLPPENLPQIARTLSSKEFWQDLSEAERRVYLREFIRTVYIVRQGDRWDIQIQFVF